MDYEKKYKELVAKLTDAYNDESVNDERFCCVMNNIMPELAESDDERIRAALIYHYQGDGCLCTNEYRIDYKEIRAWLEKHGQTFTQKDVDDAYLEGVCDAKHELEKQGEQKPVELHQYLLSQEKYAKAVDECIYGEQKPWSEEDAVMLNKLISVVKLYYGYSGNDLDKQSCISFLESLKDRVQPQSKQGEWSEDGWTMQDEEELQIALDTLVKAGQHSSAKWLKNVCLRPQNTWRPSDEQMKALSNAGNSFRPFEEGHKVLWGLYNDLKKLREE